MENGQAFSRRQNRAERMRRRRIRFFIVLGFLAVCTALIAVLFCAPVFQVGEVFCVGNEKISTEELISAAEVQMGKNIFRTNISEIKKRIAGIPYVEDSNVRRIFPNKIKIWVRENRPAAYVYSGDKLAVVDLSAKVLEVIESPEQVRQLAGDLEEDPGGQPSASPDPSAGPSASPEPTPEPDGEEASEEDEDSDGEEGPDASASPEPEETPQPEPTIAPDVFHQIPVLYGLELKHPGVGHKAASDDQAKLDTVIGALNNLQEAGLLNRTTKMDVTDLSDVKFVIEGRLDLWVGTLDNFKYKINFASTVINEKLSPYEHAIMDYRGRKLYVRSPESSIPKDFSLDDLSASPSPDPDGEEDEQGDEAPKPTAKTDEEDEEEPEPTPSPKASPKPSPSPSPSPNQGGVDDIGDDL